MLTGIFYSGSSSGNNIGINLTKKEKNLLIKQVQYLVKKTIMDSFNDL